MKQNFIDGRWLTPASPDTFTKPVPSDPARAHHIADAGVHDTEVAIAAAVRAAQTWAFMGMRSRADILDRIADALQSRSEAVARTQAEETGQPITFCRHEVVRAVRLLHGYAAQANQPTALEYSSASNSATISVRRRPLGVAAVFSPWYSPVLGLVAKLGAALLWGNTVVVKLPEWAPRSGLELGDCLLEAGLPAGVVNLLTGATGRVGDVLVQDPRIKAVTWNGTNRVPAPGVRLMSLQAGQRLQQTLGGRNPLIVLADADLDRAVDAAFAGAFAVGGQQISATKLIFVHHSLIDQFRAAVLDRMTSAAIGDPFDERTELGPLVNEGQLQALTLIVDGLEAAGATVHRAGRPEGPGYYAPATLIEGAKVAETTSLEGVLGPVALLAPCDSLSDAVAQCAEVDAMVSASLFTDDPAAARWFEQRIRAGSVHINMPTTHVDDNVPNGGVDESGWGPRQQGVADVELYTDLVTTYQDFSSSSTDRRVHDDLSNAEKA